MSYNKFERRATNACKCKKQPNKVTANMSENKLCRQTPDIIYPIVTDKQIF